MGEYEFDDDEPYIVIERHSGSVGSFLMGIAIGAGVAMLFAPRSGEETRRELGRSARRARRAAHDLAGGVADTVTESYQDARHRVEQRIETARQAIDLKKQQVSRAMEAGREAALAAREDLEKRIAETKAAYEAGATVARNARAAGDGPPSGAGSGTLPSA